VSMHKLEQGTDFSAFQNVLQCLSHPPFSCAVAGRA
jgi:hypothetical protein